MHTSHLQYAYVKYDHLFTGKLTAHPYSGDQLHLSHGHELTVEDS